MSLNDAVFFVGSLLFAAALLPSVFGQAKPDLKTSLMTASILVAFSINYATLSLWFASVAAALTAALWFVLAYQRKQELVK